MDERELVALLQKSVESNRDKYLPWWDVDTKNCIYKYDLFQEEEVRKVTECIKACPAETLSMQAGSAGLTVFHFLVWCGFYDAVKEALARGVEVDLAAPGKENNKEAAGVTPFLVACYRGNHKMAKLLLEHGADSAACDQNGRNAYHYLAGVRIGSLANGYEIVKNSLLQREQIARLVSGNVNARDEQGMTPFERAMDSSNSNYSWALADVLMEKGADTGKVDEDGNSLLMVAIRKNHLTAAFRLMEKRDLINLQNKEGKTPLHLAVESYRMGLCMALLDKKADKNLPDQNGKTPKDIALEKNDADYKQLFTTGRLKLNTLSRFASNAFAEFSEDERDKITLALYLAKKVIQEADPDDDDEMGQILNMLYSALLNDEKCRVLDMLQEAGIDFVAPIHSSGTVECIRDYCLGGNYGVKVIKKLLELGVDMDAPVLKGRTPANIVASLQERNMMFGGKDHYFEEAAKFFSCESMECVDDSGTTALHEAAKNNHADMLRVMLEKGANIDIAQDEPVGVSPICAGNTPLHVACMYGKGDVVKLLMDSGADDTLQNVKGETPAHLAMKKKNFGPDLKTDDRINILEALQHVDIAGSDGRTPLMLIAYLGLNAMIDILPVLLEKGVDVNHQDNAGNTALLLVAQNQCYNETVKELYRAGADINAVNKEGNTPLHFALQYGNQESAIFMIKKGADYNHANNRGITPAQIAVEKGYDTVLGLMTDIQ